MDLWRIPLEQFLPPTEALLADAPLKGIARKEHMEEHWTYYVPLIIQSEGQVGFAARIVQLNSALNSQDAVWGMIEKLTLDILGEIPASPDELPVMPLGWTLITARRSRKGNGKP